MHSLLKLTRLPTSLLSGSEYKGIGVEEEAAKLAERIRDPHLTNDCHLMELHKRGCLNTQINKEVKRLWM